MTTPMTATVCPTALRLALELLEQLSASAPMRYTVARCDVDSTAHYPVSLVLSCSVRGAHETAELLQFLSLERALIFLAGLHKMVLVQCAHDVKTRPILARAKADVEEQTQGSEAWEAARVRYNTMVAICQQGLLNELAAADHLDPDHCEPVSTSA